MASRFRTTSTISGRSYGRNRSDTLDMEEQRQNMAIYRRQQHDKWVSEHQARTRFGHDESRVRADLIINEARRLEREHLQHQLAYARALVRRAKRGPMTSSASSSAAASGLSASPSSMDSTPPPKLSSRRNVNTSHAANAGKAASPSSQAAASPTRIGGCDSPDCGSPRRTCACLSGPLCRQITPKYRALALLKQTFEHDKVEEAWETLRETYASDHDMLEDLIYRYGPEPEDVSPNTRLRCVEEKVRDCDDKWRSIGAAAMEDMRYRDAFPNVIRNLSIMRIFLEGSQASVYGCDTSERSRRDAFHQNVLDQLAMERSLFLTPRRERSASPSFHH